MESNVLSYTVSYNKQTKHTRTNTYRASSTACAKPIFAQWNQMKQISRGQCGACITLLGLCDAMSDRNPHRGREEGEERNTGGTTGFNWDITIVAAARRVWIWVSFRLYMYKKGDINSWHRLCVKQNEDGMEKQKRKYKSANSTHLGCIRALLMFLGYEIIIQCLHGRYNHFPNKALRLCNKEESHCTKAWLGRWLGR